MNKKFILITAILTVFSFSSLVYAQEAYSFSGFGGGLPSSATIVETSAVTPDELSASAATTTSSEVLVTTLIIGGVLVVGGLVMIATLSTEGGKEFMAECAGEAVEECMVQSIDACIEETCSGEAFKFIMPVYIP